MSLMRTLVELVMLLTLTGAVASPGGSAAGGAGAFAASACAPLVPQNVDGNYVVPGVLGEVVYKRTSEAVLTLDLYAPADDVVRPLVVVVHGGGFQAGSSVSFVGQFLELLTEAGYAWASVEYGLRGPARWQEAVSDVADALAFLQCHGRAAGFDPARVALFGEDTGAQIAAHVASTKESVAATVLVGAQLELAPAAGVDEDSRRRAALLAGGTAAVVPHGRALVVHGAADSEAPLAEARAWCDGVRARQRRCELIAVADGIHRAENWRPAQWGYKQRITEWLAGAIGAGSPAAVPQPAAESRGALHKNIVFAPETGLTLDAWIPRGRGPHVPVLLVHGGGWEAGDKVTYITPLFAPLARAGLAWFSIDYRLTPDVRHPAQLDDLRRAIAFVQREADRFDVDPRRLVLIGESASAQMVAHVGLTDSGVAGVIPFYGVYDFLPMAASAGPRSIPSRLFGFSVIDAQARETLRAYSPIARVRREQPPMLLVHGTNEGLWEQGRAMAARLREAGAPHELYALEGAPHGMEQWEGRPEWQGYKQKVVSWIAEVTRTP